MLCGRLQQVKETEAGQSHWSLVFIQMSAIVKPSGVMDSVYSEGLDGEKSRPPWNQLSSSVCILCAYCSLQFPKKAILASLGFQTPVNCPMVCFAEYCHQGIEPV